MYHPQTYIDDVGAHALDPLDHVIDQALYYMVQFDRPQGFLVHLSQDQ